MLRGMRLLVLDSTLTSPHKLVSAGNAQDLLPSLYTFRALKEGWHTIDLTNQNIRMPAQPLVILFTILENDVEFKDLPLLGITTFTRHKLASCSPKKNNIMIFNKSIGKLISPMISIYIH